MKTPSNFLLPLLILLLPLSLHAKDSLTLKEYLQQVTSKNSSYRAAELYTKAYDLKTSEASLDFLPQFISNLNYTDNRLIPSSPLYPAQTITWGGSLGVQTKLRSGTQLGLTYNSTFTNMSGSPFSPAQSYYFNYPQITISQPLWKDFWAAASKAAEDAQISTFKSLALQQKYSQQLISFNAETTYWKLALYKQIVEFDKQALARADKILKRNQKRVSMNVADKVDLLQSQASYKQRELQLETDLSALKQTSSAFNALRNMQGDLVEEDILPIDRAMEDRLVSDLKRAGERLDVQATAQNAEAQKYQFDAIREKVKPDVSLYGTAQFSGKNPTDYGQAQSDSFSTTNPLYTVGVKISIPLDFSLISEINQGNRAASQAAQMTATRARFDLDQDWSDLLRHYKEVSTRFKMARELEDLQKEKLDNEVSRLAAGRTTLFQVLQFEDGFFDAQLNRLRIENEAITLRAQARLYNGENL